MLTLNRVLRGLAAALTLAASAAIADSYHAPATAPSTISYKHKHDGSARLPKELKLVWRAEEKAHMKALPKEQRHGWLKAKWRSMSPQQQQTKLAELESKWKALPESTREHLLDKKRRKHEAHLLKRSEKRSDVSGEEQPASQ